MIKSFKNADECWADFVKAKACCTKHLSKESFRRGQKSIIDEVLPVLEKFSDIIEVCLACHSCDADLECGACEDQDKVNKLIKKLKAISEG